MVVFPHETLCLLFAFGVVLGYHSGLCHQDRRPSFELKHEDTTREQRVELMKTDIKAYLDLHNMDHFHEMLDNIAQLGPYEPEEEE